MPCLAAMAGGLALFPVEIRSHDFLRSLLTHDAGVPGFLRDLPSRLESGKWQEDVLEMAFWEVISVKRDPVQKCSIGKESTHAWEGERRPELPALPGPCRELESVWRVENT